MRELAFWYLLGFCFTVAWEWRKLRKPEAQRVFEDSYLNYRPETAIIIVLIVGFLWPIYVPYGVCRALYIETVIAWHGVHAWLYHTRTRIGLSVLLGNVRIARSMLSREQWRKQRTAMLEDVSQVNKLRRAIKTRAKEKLP